jgi:hypothetical protein
MKVFIYKKFWTVETTKKYPKLLFIYGDNDTKTGKGGQAVIRYAPNTAGIPTKKIPNNLPTSFYTDDELELNKTKIKASIQEIITKLSTTYDENNKLQYNGIMLPEDGFGTGLARLNILAPKTFEFLNLEIAELKKKVYKL